MVGTPALCPPCRIPLHDIWRCEADHIGISQSAGKTLRACSKEASVALSGNQSSQRGIDWLAIVRILLMQVLVLAALSAAFVGYVNWSSDRAWEEFIAA